MSKIIGNTVGTPMNPQKFAEAGKSAYDIAVKHGFEGTESEWIASLYGKPGVTPHIGANGHWFIGETDTGVKAQGEPGDDYVLTEADKQEIAEKAAELVDIPEGGGSAEEVWEDIVDITLSEDVASLHISTDSNGNSFSLREFTVFVVQTPITGKTTNDQFAMTINGQGWGNPSAMRLTNTPKEDGLIVYSYFHVKTVDGVMEKVRANISSNYTTLRDILAERDTRKAYENDLCIKVNTANNTIKTTAMPCTKISFVGIGGTILGVGSQIKVRGVRT